MFLTSPHRYVPFDEAFDGKQFAWLEQTLEQQLPLQRACNLSNENTRVKGKIEDTVLTHTLTPLTHVCTHAHTNTHTHTHTNTHTHTGRGRFTALWHRTRSRIVCSVW